ncbi:hypothetical protein C8Q79DRAFT_384899 [Trametes meyenii]|nr:hypothetical protein C8Q79DRAFT_384899 [Trametes meyenii]
MFCAKIRTYLASSLFLLTLTFLPTSFVRIGLATSKMGDSDKGRTLLSPKMNHHSSRLLLRVFQRPFVDDGSHNPFSGRKSITSDNVVAGIAPLLSANCGG